MKTKNSVAIFIVWKWITTQEIYCVDAYGLARRRQTDRTTAYRWMNWVVRVMIEWKGSGNRRHDTYMYPYRQRERIKKTFIGQTISIVECLHARYRKLKFTHRYESDPVKLIMENGHLLFTYIVSRARISMLNRLLAHLLWANRMLNRKDALQYWESLLINTRNKQIHRMCIQICFERIELNKCLFYYVWPLPILLRASVYMWAFICTQFG